MKKERTLIVVDSCSRRRAALCFCLAQTDIHAEPYDDIDELKGHWSDHSAVLAFDEGPVLNGIFSAMAEEGVWLPVVAYAPEPAIDQVVEAVSEGAVEYLAWPFGADQLLEKVSRAIARSGKVENVKLRERIARGRVARLTARERQVLAGLADGLPNRMIGERLSISPRTVEIHRANMLRKLDANHSSEAIRIAIEASVAGLGQSLSA